MDTNDILTIPPPDDFHVHLRGPDDLLPYVLPFTASVFQRALVMPNTKPNGIEVAQRALDYELAIRARATASGFGGFQPLMTLYLTDDTTPQMIREAREAGVIAGKVYPVGVTTNSERGVTVIKAIDPVFRAMEECGMVLCLHGQVAGTRVRGRDREVCFLNEELYRLTQKFPGLRTVLEHVSTYEAVHTVLSLPKTVAATITVHHLVLTEHDIDDLKLQPHHFCLPRPNDPRDREALRWAATQGSSKFFLGTDSAPHLVSAKEQEGKAGVFSAPVALPLLAQVFEEEKALKKLADFTSKFGAQFYDLPLNQGHLTLVKRPWQVPSAYPGGGEATPTAQLIPFYAGRTLQWQVLR